MPLFGKRNPPAQRQCEFCGKSFPVRSSWQSQRFCSHDCYAESIRRIRVTKEELEYWYYELGMTSIEIAEQLGCSDRYLRQIMDDLGLTLRNKSHAAMDYACRAFSGDSVEKAYLIGFRTGDLNVRKDLETSQRICVRSSTTRKEQIDLIVSLFEQYGHINARRGSIGETQIECRLDTSIAFLLEKPEDVPGWIQQDDSCFWAFAAGYTDAEGYINTRRNGNHEQAIIEIASCDAGVLQGLSSGFNERGVTCSLYLRQRGGTINKRGQPMNRDFYRLTIVREASVDLFFTGVNSYLRHADKRARMQRAWALVRS